MKVNYSFVVIVVNSSTGGKDKRDIPVISSHRGELWVRTHSNKLSI